MPDTDGVARCRWFVDDHLFRSMSSWSWFLRGIHWYTTSTLHGIFRFLCPDDVHFYGIVASWSGSVGQVLSVRTYLVATNHGITWIGHLVVLSRSKKAWQVVRTGGRVIVVSLPSGACTDRVFRGVSLSRGVCFLRRVCTWGRSYELLGIFLSAEA